MLSLSEKDYVKCDVLIPIILTQEGRIFLIHLETLELPKVIVTIYVAQ